MRGVGKKVETVKEFITTPKGVFQTIDEMIVNTRRTRRELVQTIKHGMLGERTDYIPRRRVRRRILKRR